MPRKRSQFYPKKCRRVAALNKRKYQSEDVIKKVFEEALAAGKIESSILGQRPETSQQNQEPAEAVEVPGPWQEPDDQSSDTLSSEEDESPQTERTQTESLQAECTQAESLQAECTQAESPQAECTKAECTQAESLQAESLQAESLQAECTQAECTQAECTQAQTEVPLKVDLTTITSTTAKLKPPKRKAHSRAADVLNVHPSSPPTRSVEEVNMTELMDEVTQMKFHQKVLLEQLKMREKHERSLQVQIMKWKYRCSRSFARCTKREVQMEELKKEFKTRETKLEGEIAVLQCKLQNSSRKLAEDKSDGAGSEVVPTNPSNAKCSLSYPHLCSQNGKIIWHNAGQDLAKPQFRSPLPKTIKVFRGLTPGSQNNRTSLQNTTAPQPGVRKETCPASHTSKAKPQGKQPDPPHRNPPPRASPPQAPPPQDPVLRDPPQQEVSVSSTTAPKKKPLPKIDVPDHVLEWRPTQSTQTSVPESQVKKSLREMLKKPSSNFDWNVDPSINVDEELKSSNDDMRVILTRKEKALSLGTRKMQRLEEELERFLTKDQIKSIFYKKGSHGMKWSDESIRKMLRIRKILTMKGYLFLQHELFYPAPSLRTLSKRVKEMGGEEAVLAGLEVGEAVMDGDQPVQSSVPNEEQQAVANITNEAQVLGSEQADASHMQNLEPGANVTVCSTVQAGFSQTGTAKAKRARQYKYKPLPSVPLYIPRARKKTTVKKEAAVRKPRANPPKKRAPRKKKSSLQETLAEQQRLDATSFYSPYSVVGPVLSIPDREQTTPVIHSVYSQAGYDQAGFEQGFTGSSMFGQERLHKRQRQRETQGGYGRAKATLPSIPPSIGRVSTRPYTITEQGNCDDVQISGFDDSQRFDTHRQSYVGDGFQTTTNYRGNSANAQHFPGNIPINANSRYNYSEQQSSFRDFQSSGEDFHDKKPRVHVKVSGRTPAQRSYPYVQSLQQQSVCAPSQRNALNIPRFQQESKSPYDVIVVTSI